jgi:pimeloyl-ACP methyl ester carboxylesterase
MKSNPAFSGYSEVNGLRLYYEMHGDGQPLVLVHGGGSTIESSFGNILPFLAAKRQIIAVEMQAHGRTSDRDADLSFEQDADDIAILLNNLDINKADVLGFSNGGHTAIELSLRHPQLVRKLVLASINIRRDALPAQFWDGFQGATLDMMPSPLREAYLKVNNSEAGLLNMFNKDVKRMKHFSGWSNEQIQSINSPTLVINGNQDVAPVEHAVEIYRLIPNCQLAIFPGAHGTYLGTIESLPGGQWPKFNAVELINEFLDK